jgi:hypothetical protein
VVDYRGAITPAVFHGAWENVLLCQTYTGLRKLWFDHLDYSRRADQLRASAQIIIC